MSFSRRPFITFNDKLNCAALESMLMFNDLGVFDRKLTFNIWCVRLDRPLVLLNVVERLLLSIIGETIS